jgi:EmrB/QacA subfamily drug resistance transporter
MTNPMSRVNPAGWRGNPWAILVVVSMGLFMTQLDVLVLAIAIPDIVTSLHAPLSSVVLALNSYVLVLAVLVITTGRLGDLRGQRRVFALGVGLFTLSSLLGGLSQNVAELIAARAVQGLGAALLIPPTLALVVAVFPADRRGSALGVRGAVAGAAAVSGPVLGGLLVSALDWRWVLFINVPVGILVLAGTWLLIPDVETRREHRLDVPGALLASAALFCFTFALSEGQRYRWSAWIWVLLAAAPVLFAVFARQQRKAQNREPLIPFALFKRNYTVMNAVSVTSTIGVLGLVLVLSVFFQSAAGFSALKTGMIIAPASIVSMAFSPLAGRMSDRRDARYLICAGFLLTAAGMLWSTLAIGTSAAWAVYLLPMAAVGLGNAFMITPIAALALHEVTPETAGAASGVMSSIAQLGSVVGTASIGALLQNRLASAPTQASAAHTTMLVPIAMVLIGAAVSLTARAVPGTAPPAPKGDLVTSDAAPASTG